MRHASLAFALLLVLSSSASAQMTATGTPTGVNIVNGQVALIDDLAHANRAPAGVSGTDGPYQEQLLVPNGAWVTGIKIGERNNRPCFVGLMWSTIDNGGIATGQENEYCSQGPVSNSSIRTVRFSGVLPANTQGRIYAATGLKVCQNNGNDRLKGIDAIARPLNFGGDYVSTGSPSTSERDTQPNCNDWEQNYVECPGEKVMVGVRIERDSGDTVGLAPICARLQIQR